MKKVTGIGGIFFKCKDPKKVKDWYQKHLGLDTDEYGTCFEWKHTGESEKKGYTQWSPFAESSSYMEPSKRDFMINYRVDNLEALVEELKVNGVEFTDDIEAFDYGKFVHIIDVEGNKVELWESEDTEFEKIVGGKTNDRNLLEENKKKALSFYKMAYNGDPKTAVEKYVGATYTQHNPDVGDGKQAFIDYFDRMFKEYPEKSIEFVRIIAENDLVSLHTHQIWPGQDEYVTMDFFRFDEKGKIIEHWDAIQGIPQKSVHNNTMY